MFVSIDALSSMYMSLELTINQSIYLFILAINITNKTVIYF